MISFHISLLKYILSDVLHKREFGQKRKTNHTKHDSYKIFGLKKRSNNKRAISEVSLIDSSHVHNAKHIQAETDDHLGTNSTINRPISF